MAFLAMLPASVEAQGIPLDKRDGVIQCVLAIPPSAASAWSSRDSSWSSRPSARRVPAPAQPSPPRQWSEWSPAWKGAVVPAARSVAKAIQAGPTSPQVMKPLIEAQQALPREVPRPFICFDMMVDAKSKRLGRPEYAIQRARDALECYEGKPITAGPTPQQPKKPVEQMVFDTIDKFWREQFERHKRSYSSPQLKPESKYDLPSHKDGIIYYNPKWMSDQAKRYGTIAVTMAMGHEFGHHIQHKLARLYVPWPPQENELEADVFAGASVRYMYREVNPKVLEGIQSSMKEEADPPWMERTDIRSHGTFDQRWQAFLQGYNQGVPPGIFNGQSGLSAPRSQAPRPQPAPARPASPASPPQTSCAPGTKVTFLGTYPWCRHQGTRK